MTLEDIRQYCLGRGLTDGTMARIVKDYDDLIHIVEEKDKIIERLRDRVSNLETEVFSLRNQNKLWECIVADYKKREDKFIKEKMEEEE